MGQCDDKEEDNRMTAKEKAIQRIALFLDDRITYTLSTRSREHTTRESIEKMVRQELQNVPDGPEVPNE